MSKFTLCALFTVIAGIILGMLLGVPFLQGFAGALFVNALVFAFVVDQRHLRLEAQEQTA